MRRLIAAVTLVLAVVVAASPAVAAVPSGNLIVNPGAEAGAGATDSSTSLPLPGWTTANGFTAVQYGTPAFLTTDDAQKDAGGTNFFAGGPDSDTSTAAQTIDVSAAAAEIDAGGVGATLSGLIGGYSAQGDNIVVSATYLGAAGAALGTLQIGPVSAADRGDNTELLARSASGTVPAGTRSVSVVITSTRTDGAYNDGYADNLSFTFGSPPAFHQSVGVKPVSGSVLVRLPGSSTFTALTSTTTIPLGATIDTRHGKITLTSVPKAGGAPQSASFYDGIFKVTQTGSITLLKLTEQLAPCPKHGKAASAAAKKPKTRKLWGDGAGSFRTQGQYSAATVRGTKWLVEDSCSGTLTRVARGVVSVFDQVRHKTVLVRAPHSYLARAKR